MRISKKYAATKGKPAPSMASGVGSRTQNKPDSHAPIERGLNRLSTLSALWYSYWRGDQCAQSGCSQWKLISMLLYSRWRINTWCWSEYMSVVPCTVTMRSRGCNHVASKVELEIGKHSLENNKLVDSWQCHGEFWQPDLNWCGTEIMFIVSILELVWWDSSPCLCRRYKCSRHLALWVISS